MKTLAGHNQTPGDQSVPIGYLMMRMGAARAALGDEIAMAIAEGLVTAVTGHI